MKSNLVDVLIAFAVVCMLLVGFILWMPKPTESDSFTPPSWGSGRVTDTEREIITESENKLPMTESIETEAVYTCIELAETNETVETDTEFDEDINVPDTEELVEVILPIEGKHLDVPMSAELQDYVRAVSADYGIPFELTMAVIYCESSFNPAAISSTGDYGLMQVSYINHGWLASDLGITDFLDAKQSIRAGCHILAEKIRESGGDFTKALMRYHDGDDGALELMKQGIFSTKYTDDVLSKYYEYIRG